jgi:putative membrane protein
MKKNQQVIHTSEFNPNIKTYLLLWIGFILLVSVAGIPLLIFWFLGLGQYLSKRYYENLQCKLTSHHLQFKKGVLFKVEKTIPLENIQDLTFIENPLLKMLGLQTLKIETAGQSNPQGSDMQLIGIVNASNFKDSVLEQRELLRSTPQNENSQLNEENLQINNTLIEIRDILLEIKNQGKLNQ